MEERYQYNLELNTIVGRRNKQGAITKEQREYCDTGLYMHMVPIEKQFDDDNLYEELQTSTPPPSKKQSHDESLYEEFELQTSTPPPSKKAITQWTTCKSEH